MKKLLMLILIGLLLALSIYIGVKGFQIGNIEVLSYAGLQAKNKQLDEKIQESSKLAEKDFKQIVNTVKDSTKRLEQAKEEYEDMTVTSSEGEIQATSQIERYEVETLWVKLGNYATSEGAIIRMDIVQGNSNHRYNLKFTVNGSYISITDFISDIENDSTLAFKIEDFKMLPSASGSDLQATFICKDIAIKDVAETSTTTEIPEDSANTTNMNATTNNTTTTNNITNQVTGNTTNNTVRNTSVD